MAVRIGLRQRMPRTRWLLTIGVLSVVLAGAAATASVERWRIEHHEGTLFPHVVALHGEDITAASVAITREWSSDAEEVLVARDDLFADTLASGTRQADIPLLLTNTYELDPLVAEELQRLEPSQITILGGTDAVSADVAAELVAYAPSVSRLEGGSRVETAIAIADATWPGADTAIMVRGYGPDPHTTVVDSLSAGAAAAITGQPVLLTPTDALTPTLEDYLTGRFNEITIVGGTEAVSDDVVGQIEELGAAVTRVSGPERQATAVAVATDILGYDNAGDVDSVIIADGVTDRAWASGLAMAGSAAVRDAPVLLTNGTGTPAEPAAHWLADGADELVCAPFVPGHACEGIAAPLPVQITGTVVDAVTGSGLDGADVDVSQRGAVTGSTETDRRGEFSVSAPVGHVAVRGALSGYDEGQRSLRVVYEQPQSVQIPLSPLDDADIVLISGAEGAPLFTEDNLAPGDITERTVTIHNEGAPADVRFYATGEGALATDVDITVEEAVNGSYQQRFSGSLNQLLSNHTFYETGLGEWRAARGEQRTYRFTSTLPAGADNGVQGTSATATLWWEARQ